MKFLNLFPLLFFAACTANAGTRVDADPTPTDSVREITFLFAGDLMQHGTQYAAARQPDGTYSYEEVFRYVREDIQRADVAIANFETTLGGAPYSSYPQFCSPDDYFRAARDAGFDLLLTANNHSVDRRAQGICRTIAVMDSARFPHIGTYVDSAARAAQYPYILEKNGFRIALLCYTYGTNGIPVPAPCVVNTIDTVQIKRDILKARSERVDCILCFMHWGTEYRLEPTQQQVDLADWLFRQGVDHVIGGHPHVVEPMEVREGADGRRHLLVYSLGNYVSNMSKTPCDGGLMVRLTLQKDSVTRLKDCSYALTWVSRPAVSGHRNFRIYPVSVPDSLLNPAERSLFQATLSQERNLFLRSNKGDIREYQIMCTDWSR